VLRHATGALSPRGSRCRGRHHLPRQAILLILVSREGTTLEARVFGPSNLDTSTTKLGHAKNLRWNPAQKNGEPVDAWVQWPFQPVRQ